MHHGSSLTRGTPRQTRLPRLSAPEAVPRTTRHARERIWEPGHRTGSTFVLGKETVRSKIFFCRVAHKKSTRGLAGRESGAVLSWDMEKS